MGLPTQTTKPIARSCAVRYSSAMMQQDDVKVSVYKERRRLELWCGDTLRMACPVVLGRKPTGPKRASGDGRTPEGQYAVCTRNDKSKYHRALGLNYPNAQDARLALAEGRLPADQAQRIQDSIAAGVRPPWDSALGGEIMIHGGGVDGDWTAGCIALENVDMDALWELCPLGTPVEILP